MDIQVQEPFQCEVDGCGKSFKREVHLRRHQHSHDPSNVFTCQVCGKEFNRKDSLQRHTALHQDEAKESASVKGKRACISCHAGKVRCDGNEQCSRCLKKGIDCIYPKVDEEVPTSESSTVPEAAPNASKHTDLDSDKATQWPLQEEQNVPVSDINSINPPVSTTGDASFRAVAEPPKVGGGLGNFWLTTRVEKDPATPPSSTVEKDDLPRETSKIYLNTYFEYFHQKWPLIHRPSFQDEDTDPCLSILTPMRMIGAWIEGSPESKHFAISTFDNLSDQLLLRLNRITSHDMFQQSLSYVLCASALLSIVFSLHYADERQLSRAVILRNVLVGVLREVGFFQPDAAWPDQQPGYFLPMRGIREGQRQRLAAYLFKADCYLSIMRNQPPLVTIEDLHYNLPSTYALWNAQGLYTWEERHGIEPPSRQVPLSHLIHGVAANIEMLAETPLLIEDVQLCLCAAQLEIYQLSTNRATLKDGEINDAIQRTSLRIRLDALKAKLDQMTNQPTQDVDFGQEHHLPYRHYYGFEDTSQPNWQASVITRVHCLFFNSIVLYHLLSISHLSRLKRLTQIASDQNPSPAEVICAQYIAARSQREQWATKWAQSSSGRRALTHAYDILSLQQNLIKSSQVTIEIRRQDPMSHVALCVAALVMWVFCKFYDQACDLCVASPVGVLDMTRWDNAEKEAWIEMPYVCRPSIQGIQLCRCNSEFLMALFRPCLPENWGIVEGIAPGILKGGDGV